MPSVILNRESLGPLHGVPDIANATTDFSAAVAGTFGNILTPDNPTALSRLGAGASVTDFKVPSPGLSTDGVELICSVPSGIASIAAAIKTSRDLALQLLKDVVELAVDAKHRGEALRHLILHDEQSAFTACSNRIALDRRVPFEGIYDSVQLLEAFRGLPFSIIRAKTIRNLFIVDERDSGRPSDTAIVVPAIQILASYGPIAAPLLISILKGQASSQFGDIESAAAAELPETVLGEVKRTIMGFRVRARILVAAASDGVAERGPGPTRDAWKEIQGSFSRAELGTSWTRTLNEVRGACERLDACHTEQPADVGTGGKFRWPRLPNFVAAWILPTASLERREAEHLLDRSATPLCSSRMRFIAAHCAASRITELCRWHPGALISLCPHFKVEKNFSAVNLSTKEGRSAVVGVVRDFLITQSATEITMRAIELHFGRESYLEGIFGRRIAIVDRKGVLTTELPEPSAAKNGP